MSYQTNPPPPRDMSSTHKQSPPHIISAQFTGLFTYYLSLCVNRDMAMVTAMFQAMNISTANFPPKFRYYSNKNNTLN